MPPASVPSSTVAVSQPESTTASGTPRQREDVTDLESIAVVKQERRSPAVDTTMRAVAGVVEQRRIGERVGELRSTGLGFDVILDAPSSRGEPVHDGSRFAFGVREIIGGVGDDDCGSGTSRPQLASGQVQRIDDRRDVEQHRVPKWQRVKWHRPARSGRQDAELSSRGNSIGEGRELSFGPWDLARIASRANADALVVRDEDPRVARRPRKLQDRDDAGGQHRQLIAVGWPVAATDQPQRFVQESLAFGGSLLAATLTMLTLGRRKLPVRLPLDRQRVLNFEEAIQQLVTPRSLLG